jgi:hypothetical protein
MAGAVVTSAWEARCKTAAGKADSWLRSMLNSAKARNFRKGASATLPMTRLLALAIASNGRCAVSGMPFSWNGDRPLKGPFAVTLDRVDSSKPYRPGNVRLVCAAVNFGMHTWGESLFRRIARGMVAAELTAADGATLPFDKNAELHRK